MTLYLDAEDVNENEGVEQDQAPPLKLHRVHNCIAADSGASAELAGGCDENRESRKKGGRCMHRRAATLAAGERA